MTELPKNRTPGRILVTGQASQSTEQAVMVAKALGSLVRQQILEYLYSGVYSLSDVATALNIPVTTVSMHLNILEDVGLIESHMVPGKRGQKRLFTRLCDAVVINLAQPQRALENTVVTEIPIGAFIDHHVVPTCGLANTESLIGTIDDSVWFYDYLRFDAQLVWFSHGFLEYKLPNHTFPKTALNTIRISMEICSEAAPSAPNWPSDIFLEINNVRIGYWTSPGDFGETPGVLTPSWWAPTNSQYGMLKVWRVDESGSYIDGQKISSITIDKLSLSANPYISLRIGIDDDATHKGGLNLFGKHFGNHAQGIILELVTH